MTEIYFPKELWRIIKDYQIDYKAHHTKKLKFAINKINYSFGEKYKIGGYPFPPEKFKMCPRPMPDFQLHSTNFALTSICRIIKGDAPDLKYTVWYYGYGWENYRKKHPSLF